MAEYLKIIEEVAEMHKVFMTSHPNYVDKDLRDPKLCHDPTFIDSLYRMIKVNILWYQAREPIDTFKQFVMGMYLKPYMQDYLKLTKQHKDLELLRKSLLPSEPEKNKWFITVGFNHQTWDVPSCVSVIRKICENKIFKDIRGVFELFRENGEHPHCHFLVELTDTLPKSKIIEKLWATKGIKKVVLSKTYIDVKKAEDYHQNYILGIKKKEKMECIEKDKIFRKKNNIPEFFSQPIL